MSFIILRCLILVLLVILIASPIVFFARRKYTAALLATVPAILIVANLVIFYLPWALENRTGTNYFAGLTEAQSSAPTVNQFLQLFPNAEVSFRCFDPSGAPGYDAHAILHGRYELTMQLPAVFDAAGRHVVSFGEPNFYLREVATAETLADGRLSISYNAAGQRNFGLDEWKQIVASDGDFTAIGYTMKTDQPVTGFHH